MLCSFIGRADQIPFKLWASVDRGGYPIDDLLKQAMCALRARMALNAFHEWDGSVSLFTRLLDHLIP